MSDVRALASLHYVIEVLEQHRPYHARWWRADKAGYTNEIVEAGLYTKADAEQVARGDTRTQARPLLAVLAELGKPVVAAERRRAEKAETARRDAWRRDNG